MEPGREAVLAKLSEALLLEMLRQYVGDLPHETASWFAGVRDPIIGRALSAIHKEPGRRWSLTELGREAGLSRTRLAERFTRFTGRPPMTYLAEWRLHLAGRFLTDGLSPDSTVADIASRVGYSSESAFCRAFKKEFGVPPAQFRRRFRTRLA
jgi:AraC-like DNA-binding protein